MIAGPAEKIGNRSEAAVHAPEQKILEIVTARVE